MRAGSALLCREFAPPLCDAETVVPRLRLNAERRVFSTYFSPTPVQRLLDGANRILATRTIPLAAAT